MLRASMTIQVPTLPPARVHVGVVPKWDMNDLILRNCPVCGASESEPLCERPDGLTVDTCRACEMMFVGKLPSSRQLTNHYQTYASRKGYSRAGRMSWLQRVALCSQSLYAEALQQTGGILGRRVLDVGCSTGVFMEVIRFQGGLPEGVEIDASAREEARKRGFSVMEEIPSTGQYDVTLAFQVLEHLHAPGDMLAAMARLTKPDGRILLAMPNATEVSNLGRDWLGFRVDLEHFNYFTIATVAELLRRHGILIEHFWEHRQPAIIRTDIDESHVQLSLRQRVNMRIQRRAVAFSRILFPPAERFQEGSFVLSLLARKA